MADMTGLTEANVRVKLHRIKEQIKKDKGGILNKIRKMQEGFGK